MQLVTPLLTNSEVCFGNGITNGSIGYYYFDRGDLKQEKNSRFFSSPLSANITVDADTFTIEGCETEWIFGKTPDKAIFNEEQASRIAARISSHKFAID